MLRFLPFLFLISSLALFASDIDLTESKGTDQSVIALRSPTSTQIDVWNNAKIEVTFNVPVDPSSVQKNNVKLVYLSSKTNDHIKGVISYNEETRTVTYTPDQELKAGMYEVEFKSLKPTKAYKKIHIKEIKYRFFVGGEVKKADPTPTMTLLSIDINTTIPYARITLELNATDTASLTAINQTFVQEQNRTIKIKGVDNNGTYYLYNLPLVQGSNEINLTATSDKNVSYSMLFNLTSDANGSAPIGMRAGSYSGVGSLQTSVEVGTLLNVGEYLFDSNGDGVIDETHAASDSNFTVNYIQEGRYKPRVTIRTIEGPLYSSGDFALSLDVKMTEEQKDPKGAEPIDVAKAFVQAIIEDDRPNVENWLMHSIKWTEMLYSNDKRRKEMIEKLKMIDSNSWEQVYHENGAATVTATIYDSGMQQEFPIGFELTPVGSVYEVPTGRFWVIQAFY